MDLRNGIFLALSVTKDVIVKVAQCCPSLCNPMDYTVHGILQARILEWIAFPFSRESSQPRDWIQVSCIAGRFFTSWAEPQGKTKNTGVGSLSFLQWIFPTQESNWGLLHCRWIFTNLAIKLVLLFLLYYDEISHMISHSWHQLC